MIGVACIIVGSVLIAGGAFAKEFRGADLISGGATGDKVPATFSGRFLFFVVGGVFILFGVKSLLT